MLDAIGEEELRGGEYAIARAEAEPPEGIADAQDAVVAMHHALRSAGGARRIEHEGGRIGPGIERGCLLRRAQRLAPGARSQQPDRAGERRALGGIVLLEQHQLGAAVARNVRHVGVGQLAVDRDRHAAREHHAEPCCGELGRVAHRQHHCVTWTHPQCGERTGRLPHAPRELGVRNALVAAEQRDRGAVPGERRAAEQVIDGVH